MGIPCVNGGPTRVQMVATIVADCLLAHTPPITLSVLVLSCAEQALELHAREAAFPRGVQAYFRTFFVFLGLGRSKIPLKNDPEPRVSVFPKYEPI